MEQFFPVIVFIYGTILGSFLNVCIWRLPRDQSIIMPSSRCPCCNEPLKAWQNIPLISFILLRGKCGFCRSAIPFRYFLVELITGLFSAFVFYMYGFSILFFHALILFCFLAVIFYIDLEHQLIFDIVIYPGILIGLGLSFFMPPLFYNSGLQEFLFRQVTLPGLGNFLGAAIAGIIGFMFFFLIRWIATFFAKTEAMGFGDVKFAAFIGVYLGLSLALVSFFLSFFIGALAALPLLIFKIKGKKDPIAFGTFMSIGAILSLFLGNFLIFWYLHFQYFF